MGVTGHVPIIVAFTILAAYTYNSGLRAPALIAFVKDTLIYLVIIVAVIVIPYKLGGWDEIFGAAEAKFSASPNPGDGVLLAGPSQLQYATLAFGSALALFLYPHSITGVLASRDRNVIKRNMAALPAYASSSGCSRCSGYMAIKPPASHRSRTTPARPTATRSCRCCSTRCSRAGSPASRSPRSASARWCRPRSCRSPRRTCGPATSTRSTSTRTRRPKQEARSSKLASLVVKVGAPCSRSSLSTRSSPSTCSSSAASSSCRRCRPWRWASTPGGSTAGRLIAGWAAGMAVGFWTTFQIQQKLFNPDGTITIVKEHFGGSGFPLAEARPRHDMVHLRRLPRAGRQPRGLRDRHGGASVR